MRLKSGGGWLLSGIGDGVGWYVTLVRDNVTSQQE
jgi:hypothetical protein